MGPEEELQQLLAELLKYGSKTPPAAKLSSYLKLVREQRLRDSENVALYGSLLLKHYRSSLSEEEVWLVHEQVALAAMDCGAMEVAAPLVIAVQQRFPDSVRAKRVKGMYFEAAGHPGRAEELYRELYTEDATNEAVAKRLVSLEKSKGNTSGAIDLLRKYLDTYMNDLEAWEELGELYLEKEMYRQAAFCYEELLLSNPTSLKHNIRYADILYTIGGAGNCKTARSYYSKAVELSQGTSVRALYGICLCSSAATDKGSSAAADKAAPQQLVEYCAHALISIYKEGAPDMVPLVEKVLKAHS